MFGRAMLPDWKEMLGPVIRALRVLDWRQFAVSISYCPACGCERLFVRLQKDDISIRCSACRASAVTLSLIAVLRQVAPDIGSLHVYEMSARGALFEYLRKSAGKLTSSEYFPEVTPGFHKGGIQCQDVQDLTYPDASFDICTSTEVFEHVPEDAEGFAEIARVLKAQGILVFTVPLVIDRKTVKRAELDSGGKVRHLLSPEYHGDPIRRSQPILAFRNYGYDIVDRLLDAGFARAEIRRPRLDLPWTGGRAVVVASKNASYAGRLESDPWLIHSASRT